MLDAYIIDRIRRERDRVRQRDVGVPLHIEPPRQDPSEVPREERREDEQPRGTVIIDFQV